MTDKREGMPPDDEKKTSARSQSGKGQGGSKSPPESSGDSTASSGKPGADDKQSQFADPYSGMRLFDTSSGRAIQAQPFPLARPEAEKKEETTGATGGVQTA